MQKCSQKIPFLLCHMICIRLENKNINSKNLLILSVIPTSISHYNHVSLDVVKVEMASLIA